MSETDDWLKAAREQRSARTGLVLISDPRKPDEVAEHLKIGEALGVPANVVGTAPEVFRKQVEQKTTTQALASAPLTAKWLSDIQNGALAKDDVDSLVWLEAFDSAATRAIVRGGKRLPAVLPAARASRAAAVLPDIGRSVGEIVREELDALGPDPVPAAIAQAQARALRRHEAASAFTEEDKAEVARRGAEALFRAREITDAAASIPMSAAATAYRDGPLARAQGGSLMDFFGTLREDPVGAAAFIAETAAEMLPVLAASTGVTLATGSPVAGVATMAGGSFAIESSTSILQFIEESGADLTTPEGALAALLDADMMKSARQRGLSRAFVIAAFDGLSGGVAGQALSKSPAVDLVAQGVAQMVMGSAGEGAGQIASGQQISWADIAIEGLAEVVTMPIEVGGVAGRAFFRDQAAAAQGEATTVRLQQIDERVAASKLKARSPEKFRGFLDQIGFGGTLYVPADDLNTFFQAKDYSLEEGAAALGVNVAEFNELLATGGDVAIAETVYADRISGTEDAAWFHENARVDGQEMSRAQAQRFNEEVADVMADAFEESEQIRIGALEARASDQQIYDGVYEQLRSAGRTKTVAENEARVWAAFFRTMGERYGEDPLDLSRQYGVTIRGPQTDPMRLRGNLDIALNTLRSGRMPKPGRSLLQFIKDEGGLPDAGGDLAAMDLSGIIAETADEVKARASSPSMFGGEARKGLDWDEMGRRAVEAGYFPDLTGEVMSGTDAEATDFARVLMAAISEEASGNAIYPEGQGPDTALQSLADEIARRGLDLAAMSNDEIAAALDAADGNTFDQSGTLKTDTPEFRAWFRNSKVVDADGEPLVVYHGTSAEFEAFDIGRAGETTKGNPTSEAMEGTARLGFWFSERNDIAALIAADRQVEAFLSIQYPFITDLDSLAMAIEASGSPEKVRNDLIDDGKDGIKLYDQEFDSTSYVAFYPEQIKSVENRGTFDLSDPRMLFQDKRGSIQFPDGGMGNGQTVINLFQSADLTTFLHESSHYFLNVFADLADRPDAPAEMKEDIQTIRDWLGNDGGPFTRDQQEQWARGGEAYFMEGKAPSLGLADAFGRFKAWLLRVYRSVAALDVKITPEIRKVMDRMLATDAEIKAAREAQGIRPLFTDQAAAGMSDAAWATYQRMARRSAEQAEQKLLETTMEKVRRETQKWWKEERNHVLEQVTQEVNSRREYRLIEMLANQTWIGGEGPHPDIQIDRAELVEMFGDGVLAELSRTKLGGKRAIYGKDGMSVYEAADLFGFASPAEMVSILQNAGKRKDAIIAEVDRVMLDRYGDPLSDGSIEEAALEAIHSDQQAMTLAAEVRHVAGRAGLPTRNLTATVFRARAKEMIRRMSVREATRPHAFLDASRKAGKKAEDAFAKVARGRGAEAALGMAARFKEQQLLNHYLYLESRDLTKLVDAKREKMRAYDKKSVREKLAGDYIQQIDALLDRYDFRVRGLRQINRAESLADYVRKMEAAGRGGELAIDQRLLDESKRVHYTRLSVDELRGLFDTIDNIDHMGRFKQKLQDAKEARDLEALATTFRDQMLANVKGSPPERTENTGEARRKLGRDYLNTVLNADTLLREIDGFEEIGPVWSMMKSGIDAALNRVVERRQDMAAAFDAIYNVYSAAEKRDMAKKVHNPALGGAFSKWDVISLALNTGNEDNFQRLTNPNVAGHFQQGAIEAALAELDARDWQTVQAIWDYIGSFWPEISAKELRQKGVAPEKVPAKVMVKVAPGFVTGGYYPIKYDARLSGLTEDFHAKELAEEIMSGRFGNAQTRNGHTKARAESTRQTIKLDLSVAHSHVEQVIYDLELGEPTMNAWKILHHPLVREAFTQKGKLSDFDALEIWVQDVATGDRISAGGLQTFLRHLRSGFTISRLAFNISTALIQPTGIVQSAVLIGKRDMARGYIDYMAHRSRWVDDVWNVSALMRERQLTFQRDIFNVVGDLDTGPRAGWQKFMRDYAVPASFWLMMKVQFHAVDMPTYVAAYQKEIRASGNEAKARAYADLMVKRGQGSGLMSDRGMLERGTLNKQSRQQELPRMMTALGSYMFAKFNVAYERGAKTNFRSPAEVMSLAVDIALLFTLEAFLYSAVKGFLPDDDDEWAEWAAKETALSMLATLPVGREFSGALSGFGGGGIFGSGIEVFARPFIQAAQGDADRAFVTSVIDAGGVAFKLPSSQVNKAVRELFDEDMSINSDPSFARAIGLNSGQGRSAADLMFGSN